MDSSWVASLIIHSGLGLTYFSFLKLRRLRNKSKIKKNILLPMIFLKNNLRTKQRKTNYYKIVVSGEWMKNKQKLIRCFTVNKYNSI